MMAAVMNGTNDQGSVADIQFLMETYQRGYLPKNSGAMLEFG